MREDQNMSSSARGEQAEPPSRERRLLLKAAATTAPLIATLPSGAAFANASAADCVVKDHARSRAAGSNLEVNVPDIAGGPPGDDFLRMSAWQRKCNASGAINFYYYIIAEGQWYKDDGTAVDQADVCNPLVLPGAVKDMDVQVYVLTHWLHEDEFQGVHRNGFYPSTKLVSDDDMMGITATCLCSVDAGYLPDGEEGWCNRA